MKVEGERGQEDKPYEERAFEIFRRIQEEAQQRPELKEIFEDLRGSLIRYNESILRLEIAQQKSMERKDIENADHARKIVHDALIDKLNILSREFDKAGFDNSWRKMVGLHRETAAEWARGVGTVLKNSILEENEFEK